AAVIAIRLFAANKIQDALAPDLKKLTALPAAAGPGTAEIDRRRPKMRPTFSGRRAAGGKRTGWPALGPRPFVRRRKCARYFSYPPHLPSLANPFSNWRSVLSLIPVAAAMSLTVISS